VGTEKDVPLLLPRLQDPDPDVRKVSMRSLQMLGGPAQKKHVQAMLQDPDPEVRQLAQKILQEWEAGSKDR
jgi:HEAT repeat protein